MACGILYSLVVVTASGIFSGQPSTRVLFDDLPSRAACLQLVKDIDLVPLGQRTVCIPRAEGRP